MEIQASAWALAAPAAPAEEDLVDVGALGLLAVSRDDAERGRDDGTRARHAIAVAKVGDRPAHRVAHAVGEIGRRHGAARRVPGNAADAVLLEVHAHPAE